MAAPQLPAQESADLRRDLANAIETLPVRCRSILWLRYNHGFEPPEVADRLGYSPTSISKVTNRCLAALMRQLTAAGMGKKR